MRRCVKKYLNDRIKDKAIETFALQHGEYCGPRVSLAWLHTYIIEELVTY